MKRLSQKEKETCDQAITEKEILPRTDGLPTNFSTS